MMNGRNSHNEKAQIAESYNKLYSQFSSPDIKEVGNYSIIKLIGEGAFGKVYLANHKLTHTKVVLKTGAKDDPNLVREVFYHRQFKHPNITRLYEVVISEGMIWMVLEYCPGRELYDYVLAQGRVPVDETKKLFAQIVGAVHYAHSLNCIHRDLKLENILLDKRKNAKLSDFGFTRECEHRSLLETVCGTTVYMAPELIQKNKYDGFKVDIWSLGVILYTLLYGTMPFDEDDDFKNKYNIINEEPTYLEDIPREAITLMKKILTKTPSERPNTAEILNDPFLEPFGNQLIETTNSLLKQLATNKNFSTRTEKYLLKKLKSLGIDIHALQKSVVARNCDSLAGLWEILLEKQKKKEAKKYKTRSRSVLRISENTSRRVSQFMEPITTPQLSRIVSYKSNIIRTSSNSNTNNGSIRVPSGDFNSLKNPNTNTNTTSVSASYTSPEKKKNGFISKFTKFWKKKDDNYSHSLKLVQSQISINSHYYPLNNINETPSNSSQNGSAQALKTQNSSTSSPQPPKQQIDIRSTSGSAPLSNTPQQLTIQEPKSPVRSNTGPSSRRGQKNTPRQRPTSILSQHSLASQLTTMSDLSTTSINTTQSETNHQRPPFTKRASSDTSLHSKNTTKRSLSLISSNSSTSERSSRKSSFYDYSSGGLEFKVTQMSRGRGRRYNEGAIFPKSISMRRRKSPLGGGLALGSKFKQAKSQVIQEEDDSIVENNDMEDLEEELNQLRIAESTRKSSDFEDDLSIEERGRTLEK